MYKVRKITESERGKISLLRYDERGSIFLIFDSVDEIMEYLRDDLKNGER